MYRVFALAGVSRCRFRARRGSGLAVALRYHRVLVVIDGVEGISGSVADATAKLTVFLIAMVPTVAVHVVLLEARASGCFSGFLFVVGAVGAAGTLATTLGAVAARDAAQLLEELVVDLEVLGVGLGEIGRAHV